MSPLLTKSPIDVEAGMKNVLNKSRSIRNKFATADKKRKEEFYYGNSFLSQSARFISYNEKVKLITIIDQKGISRKNNY
jgi:hypothetical protein